MVERMVGYKRIERGVIESKDSGKIYISGTQLFQTASKVSHG